MIEKRQIANVQRQRAARAFLIDDDGDGASFDAIPETDPASAGEPRVRKTFQHPVGIILQERLDLLIDLLL